MSAETVAGVLNAAADRLEKPGAWINDGSFGADERGCVWNWDHEGLICYCAAAAILLEAENPPLYLGAEPEDHPAIVFFARHVDAESPDRISVGAWNDAPGRTQSEVVSKLREAAAKALSSGASLGDGK